MGQYANTGSSIVVYGDPQSFKDLISNHGQLCKIKQALICPCVAANAGSPDTQCTICNGDGYIYTYQRKFLVTDEDSPVEDETTLAPFWTSIMDVVKVQNVTSDVQGGITILPVSGYDESYIYLVSSTNDYEEKKVTYYFDGWTYVESELLVVDTANKLMYVSGTIYDAEYQSSNPLNAYADIADIVRIWNNSTGTEISGYEIVGGNTISYVDSTDTIDADNMYIEYYYADLSKVITTDLVNKDNIEEWTTSLKSGECKMAFYPWCELTKGDLIILPAVLLNKNESIEHQEDYDRLYEMEIFSLNDKIIDGDGNIYNIGDDYILSGRYIKWVGSQPTTGKVISVRYSYKPSYVIFEDNPNPNDLENKMYPIVVLTRSWSKMNKDDVARLIKA